MRLLPDFDPDPTFAGKTNRHFLPEAQTERVMLIIESKLAQCVEKIDGRVPRGEDIAKHGTKLVQPCGDWTFCWRGRKILRVDFYPDRVDIYPCHPDGSPLVPEGAEG